MMRASDTLADSRVQKPKNFLAFFSRLLPPPLRREAEKEKDRTVLFEPRGAWKTLLDSGFGGGNALVSRLRRDPALSVSSDFEFLRKR